MVIEEIVKVTRNFQVTIPASIRRRLRIKEGDKVKIILDEREGVIKIIPIKRRRLTIKLGRSISVEEIEEAVREMLDEATS
jgi:antitoxin PrlF